MRIGEVASQAGVNVQTLRYYERRGLLKEPPRRYTGERRYPPATVAFIQAIKRAQALGFTLDEIGHLLGGQRSGQDLAIALTAAEKLREVDVKLGDLHRIRQRLALVVDRGCDSLIECSCGQCPLEETTELAGDVPVPARPVALGSGERVRGGGARRFVPVAIAGVGACLACLAPAVLAGGVGLGVFATLSVNESVEVGAAAGAAFLAGVMATFLVSRPYEGSNCPCPGH